MDRRTYLRLAAGVGASTSLAGCTDLFDRPTSADQPDDEMDTDAPPSVSELKEDILNQVSSAVRPVRATDGINVVETLVAGAEPHNLLDGLHTNAGDASLPLIMNIRRERATISMRPESIPEGHRIFLVGRVFPRRSVIAYGLSDPVDSGGGRLSVPVELDEPLPKVDEAYLTAFAVPDVSSPDDLSLDDLTYLGESDPIAVTDTGMAEVDEPEGLDEVDADSHTRVPVQGGYLVSISGRTRGVDWEVPYYISKSAYVDRKREPRGRSRQEYVKHAVTGGVADEVAETVRSTYNEKVERQSGATLAEFTVDFVHQIPYIRDDVSTGYDDYEQFLEETLTDLSGDCEDTTILLASLLVEFGHDVVLAEFPSHIGVAVAGDYDGSYFEYDGEEYYYIETTSPGWRIGDVPEELVGKETELFPV